MVTRESLVRLGIVGCVGDREWRTRWARPSLGDVGMRDAWAQHLRCKGQRIPCVWGPLHHHQCIEPKCSLPTCYFWSIAILKSGKGEGCELLVVLG